VDGNGIDLRDRSGADGRRELLERIEGLEAQLASAHRLASAGVVAAMAIHEFRNLFTPMQNYARLALRGNAEARAKTVELAGEGAPRAAAICEALLDLAGGDPARRESVTVSALVDETLAAMGRDLAKDGIRLVRSVPSRLRIDTRPVELKQVLLNLLLNAREAVLAKGRGRSIEVKAMKRRGEVLIRVGDTGVGIRPEHRRRIFEPFFTTRGDAGSGLGLAVCRRIAEGLAGRLTFRSQHGKGTWFTLAVPAPAPVGRTTRPLAAQSA